MIKSRNLIVTRGAGFIDQILIRRLLQRDPRVVRVFNQSEPGLAAFKPEVDDDRCRFIAGNIRDKHRLTLAVNDIDIVVHTAAMKHVDISEYNPFEAVKTNAMTLQNLIDVGTYAGLYTIQSE